MNARRLWKTVVGTLVVLNLLVLGASMFASEAEALGGEYDWTCVIGPGGEPEFDGCMESVSNSCEDFEECGPAN